MIDFRKLKAGVTVEWKGAEMKVAEVLWRRKGWVRIMLTLDGDPVFTHRRCSCEQPEGVQPAVELVTEEEFLICTSCRSQVNVD